MNGERQFQRTIENFVCGNCGFEVAGDGYTNHCPQCLWSKHVDINPGDRAAKCGGMMEPVGVQKRGGQFVITHRCEACGHMRKNKSVADDNDDELIHISSSLYT